MSILGTAKACNDMDQNKDSYTKQCTTLQEKDCCSNQSIFKKGDDTFKKSNVVPVAETIVFLNTYFHTYINLFEGFEDNVISFQTYRPPLLSTDIIILNETFLI